MIIKYLLRFKTIKKERLLFKAYQEQIESINEQKNWIYNAKNILDRSGLSYIFINHTNSTDVISQKRIKETAIHLTNRIKNIFEQNIMYHIYSKSEHGEGKLIFYGKLKDRYNKENYLNIKNVEYRKLLSNIRMSSHKLQIEIGRYKNIERENRLCEQCNMKKIETEEYFLLECTAYNHPREIVSTELYSKLGVDLTKQGVEAVKIIFLQDNISIINTFAKFVKQCWHIRDTPTKKT